MDQETLHKAMKVMTEIKHTPGPWFILPEHPTHVVSNFLDPFDNKLKAQSIANCDPSGKLKHVVIANCDIDRSKSLVQRKANAELIAQAPDLLAKVSELKGLLNDVLNDVQYADHKIDKDLYNEIKKALES